MSSSRVPSEQATREETNSDHASSYAPSSARNFSMNMLLPVHNDDGQMTDVGYGEIADNEASPRISAPADPAATKIGESHHPNGAAPHPPRPGLSTTIRNVLGDPEVQELVTQKIRAEMAEWWASRPQRLVNAAVQGVVDGLERKVEALEAEKEELRRYVAELERRLEGLGMGFEG